MKKVLIIALLAAGALPLILFAQDEEAIRKTLLDFQQCLRDGNYNQAATYLSEDFIRQLKASGTEAQAAPAETGDFLHENAVAFIKNEMAGYYEQCEILGIYPEGSRADAELKPAEGGLVKLELIKDASGNWKITSARKDVFQAEQKQDDAEIGVIRQTEKIREAQEQRDQDIADDVNDDRRR